MPKAFPKKTLSKSCSKQLFLLLLYFNSNNLITNPQNRIFGLDVLRAIAILMVVSSHVLWIYPESNTILPLVLQLFGFWGVELFFVLSGFLIGSILYKLYVNDTFNFKVVCQFLKRRWFRTLPNYYLILLVNIAIAGFIGYPIQKVGHYFIFFQNFVSESPSFFTESWSLSVEEFTYILVPLALFLGTFTNGGKKSKYFLRLILFLILFFTVTKIFFNFNHTISNLSDWNSQVKSVVVYRVDAILIGILAVWFRFNFENFWQKKKAFFAFLGIVIFLFLLFGIPFFKLVIEQKPFFWNVIYLPLTSLGFVFFFPIFSQWKVSSSSLKQPIEFISKISYAIYLLHYGIILQLMKYFVDTTVLSSIERHFFTLLYLSITFFLSYILYRFYEKPMTDLRDKK